MDQPTDAPASFAGRIRHRLEKLPGNSIGALWILQAAVLFTLMSMFIKLVGQDISIFQILLIRQATMAVIVAPKILHGLPGSLYTRRPDLQVARIALACTAMLCGFSAVIYLPLAEATALGFSKTFFVTIFAIIFLSEKVGRHRWAATIVGFIGVIIMLRPGSGGLFDPYAALAIGGAAAAGLVTIILRILTRTDLPSTILTYQAVGVGLIMIIPAIYAWKDPTLEQWTLMILIGIVSWAGQMSNIRAFRAGEPTAIASLDYTRLIYATIIGVLVFGNWPGVETYIGAAFIIGGSLYVIRREAALGRALARSADSRGYNN
ncbi:Permease of the drug/metabolite transporter (DMT) superfamily [Roseibium suaedae]|uniref:Permease of the drug/metabolite transporter (DMT) superfamily n=2 Tax=Roseibium suaedae TaxID=735517 RepID=A0A1M7GP55_9HYPH|nr:Permease of the drug/metabolite transporter (DMT) superfamily [Roseibium suaedae]